MLFLPTFLSNMWKNDPFKPAIILGYLFAYLGLGSCTSPRFRILHPTFPNNERLQISPNDGLPSNQQL